MKKTFLLLLILINTFLSNAQYSPESKLNFVHLMRVPPTGNLNDSILAYRGSDGFVYKVPASVLNSKNIPLKGTDVGKPITGDLEMDIDKRIYNQLSGRIKQFKFSDDGFIEMNVYDTLDTSSASNVRVGLQQVQLFSTNGTDSNLVYVFPDKTVFGNDLELSDGKKIFITDGSFKIGGVDYGINFMSDNPVNSLEIQAPSSSLGIVGSNVFTNDGSNSAQYVQNDALQAFGDSQTLQTIMDNGSSALVDTDIQIQKGSGHGHLFINVNGVDINGEGKDLSLKGINTILEGSGNVDINGGGVVRINTKNAVTSVNGNNADSTGAINITSGVGSGTVTSVTGVGGEITVATGTTTPVVGISSTYTTARDNYANSRVADNLTASTTVAPSKTAVNTALALKADDKAVVKIAGTQTVTGLKNFTGGFGAESIVSTNGSTVGTIYLGLSSAPAYLRRNNADAISAWQTINMSSASTGNIHDFSSNVGGTTSVRASIPKNGIATSAEHLTRKDYVDGLTGWASYTDTAYTSGAPFTINSGVTSTLPNNAGTVINNQLPAGVTSFYNSGTGKFTPITDGDYYIVTIRFKAQTTAPTAGYFDFGIDIGGALGVQFKETKIFAKGAGIEHNFSVTVPCYTGSTFVANGGLIKLTSGNGNMTVYDINFQFDRVHKSK